MGRRGRRPGAFPGADANDLAGRPFAIERTLIDAAALRSRNADANHLLYLARANQNFIPGAGAGATSLDEGLARIKAPAPMLYAPEDQLFLPEWIEAAASQLRANGVLVETGKI